MQVVQPKPYIDTTHSSQAGSPYPNRFRAVGVTVIWLLRFILHFAEMWLAMLFGMTVWAYARHVLVIVGDRSFLDPVSLRSEVGHGIFMTAPMVLWMRIRGYRWRENIEMALGMIVPWAAVLALGRFGHGQPWLSERNAMAAGMLAVMLYHTWQGRFAPIPSNRNSVTDWMTNPKTRRVLMGVLLAVFFAGVSFFVLAWRPSIAPTARPAPGSFPADLVAKGEALSGAGHCAACHTQPGGQPFAGGYPLHTPFGIIYGDNISPDPQTGIGAWSLEAFTRAMRQGVARDGSHLLPAFPYYAFTKLSDDDVKALYAYLMTRPAVSKITPTNTIPAPLKIRALQEGWKILFFKSGRFQANPSKSADWNRGAYLANALSDCSGCHTPRNALGAEESRHPYEGWLVEGWIAPALTNTNPSPVPWTQEELFTYLRTGVTPLHGATSSIMTLVIRGGLELPVVPDSDIRAIALYFDEMDHASTRANGIEATSRQAVGTSDLGIGQEHDPDADLYASACMSCHYNRGPTPLPTRPELALNSSLALSEPTNFIQVVLNGVSNAETDNNTEGAAGLVMPAYGSSLTDSEIARLAAYLRRTRAKLAPWNDLEKKVAAVRREGPAYH